ncbi:hypothetical protein [Paludisphaera sp.]|uniref:hypothetical protein n=1 Tax=Paludisphaera sp. TaxID=2017432 RepID=UPI00301BC2CD
MGADHTLVFYGVRYKIAEAEIDALEARTDPRQVLARQHRLRSRWGRFATVDGGSTHYLFIGEELGIVGLEGSFEVARDAGQIAGIVAGVAERLIRAGIGDAPRLYVQFSPDA